MADTCLRNSLSLSLRIGAMDSNAFVLPIYQLSFVAVVFRERISKHMILLISVLNFAEFAIVFSVRDLTFLCNLPLRFLGNSKQTKLQGDLFLHLYAPPVIEFD